MHCTGVFLLLRYLPYSVTVTISFLSVCLAFSVEGDGEVNCIDTVTSTLVQS